MTIEVSEGRMGAEELYKKWVLLEDVHWRQESRKIRLKKGEGNASFFH